MKIGQTIYYCKQEWNTGMIPDNQVEFTDCQVYKIYKNGNIRVKVFNKEGKEMNDFIAPRKDFCLTKKTIINRIKSYHNRKIQRLERHFEKARKILCDELEKDINICNMVGDDCDIKTWKTILEL